MAEQRIITAEGLRQLIAILAGEGRRVIAPTVRDDVIIYDDIESIDDLPLDDAKTYAQLNNAQTLGVFQLESGGMQNLCRQNSLSTIDEIVALIAYLQTLGHSVPVEPKAAH